MKNPFFLKENIIDGKALAESELQTLKIEAAQLDQKPCLAVIIVGHHPPSEVYVAYKIKACEKVGIRSKLIRLDENCQQEDLIETIDELNRDPAVNGILLQLPLPSHIDRNTAIQAITPLKDVDGLTIDNQGRLFMGQPRFVPCTPLGCFIILDQLIDLRGKNIAVVGRSSLVGKPLATLLTDYHATVTMAHSQTANLKFHTQSADVIVSAVGKPGLITADHIKKDAIVLDVGITRVGTKLLGDVDFNTVAPKCAAITPVPGGVGPMTIACLMQNTLKAYKLQQALA